MRSPLKEKGFPIAEFMVLVERAWSPTPELLDPPRDTELYVFCRYAEQLSLPFPDDPTIVA